MNIGPVILGLIDVAIVVVLLLLVGLIIWHVCNKWVTQLPEEARKLYIALVALIALYMIVAIFFGLPRIRVIGSAQPQTQQSRIEPARGQIANPQPIARP